LKIFFPFFKNKSKAPKNIPHKIHSDAENFIIELRKKTNFWYKRLRYEIKANYPHLVDKYNLTIHKVKHALERAKIPTVKYKTAKWTYRALYFYSELKPFERLHYDVKYYKDENALPELVYKIWNELQLPLYVYNIIDPATRFRFVWISDSKDSTVWFNFLGYVLQFLRYIWVDYDITIGFDRWAEFTFGEWKKLEKWNRIFELIRAKCYVYENSKDIRKNLIERSHLTDDVEFLVPFSKHFKDRKTFIEMAKNWYYYYNFERAHNGINMWWKTPYEKLKEIVEEKKLNIKVEKVKEFVFMELDKNIEELILANGWMLIMDEIRNDRERYKDIFEDKKKYIDFLYKFQNLLPKDNETKKYIVNYLLGSDP